MQLRVAVVYNDPCISKYDDLGESKAEEEVLSTVDAVHRALERIGYCVFDVPLLPPLEHAKKLLKNLSADVVFNLFEGFCGYPETEADIPDALTRLGIAYTGCSTSSIRHTLNKVESKKLLQHAGICTPEYQLLRPDTIAEFKLGYPCMVKPVCDDASHGITPQSLVYDESSLAAQVEKISGIFGGQALVEQFVEGREFNATVLGNEEYTVFPVSEIQYDLPEGLPRILTYDAKWNPHSVYFQSTVAICPADLSERDYSRIVTIARSAFRVLVGSGYGRVDMRMDTDGTIYVLEVNANPDISPQAGAALQAGKMGLRYQQFIEKLVKLAWSN